MVGLGQRLTKIEEAITPPTPAVSPEEWQRRALVKEIERRACFIAGFEALAPTMDPEHVTFVMDELARRQKWNYDGIWVFDFHEANKLTRHAFSMSVAAAKGTWRGPFVLPAAVAVVWRDDPHVMANAEQCRDCGYSHPYHNGSRVVPNSGGNVTSVEPSYGYFDNCVVCGGPVGCLFYMHEHNGYPPLFPFDRIRVDEVRALLEASAEIVESDED